VLVTRAKRKWTTNGDDSNLYGLEPNFGCCTANMHQGWPKFVAHLWMAAPEGGLAAVAYGPCEVRAKVGDGTEVTVVEETSYPFDGDIKFTIKTPRPVAFPLSLRIPAWAGAVSIKAPGKQSTTEPGPFTVIRRAWRNGDQVQLRLPMRLRAETRFNNAVAILRGPLYYSLKIGEDHRELKSHHATLPVKDWEIHPTTPWNYGLVIDPKNPEKSLQVKARKAGKVPFANDAAPVVLTAKGKLISDWGLDQNSAADTPASPVKVSGPEVKLELIPYGSTRLRITEFPVIQP
jgi:DUF1680 family protein